MMLLRQEPMNTVDVYKSLVNLYLSASMFGNHLYKMTRRRGLTGLKVAEKQIGVRYRYI